MLKYLFLIVLGIIIYIVLNNWETFSIGALPGEFYLVTFGNRNSDTIKYEFIETIKLSNKQETQLMSCNSAQNLFVNGCSSEAVAISMEKQKKGIFTRFFQFFN